MAEARLGKGVEHIKYSPGLVIYKHSINPELIDFVKVDENGKISYDEEELKLKNLSGEQMSEIKKLKDSEELIFEIESWGQIKPKDIFLRAIDSLEENLDELGKELK